LPGGGASEFYSPPPKFCCCLRTSTPHLCRFGQASHGRMPASVDAGDIQPRIYILKQIGYFRRRISQPAMKTSSRPDVTETDLSDSSHEEAFLATRATESREPVSIDRPNRQPNDRNSCSDRGQSVLSENHAHCTYDRQIQNKAPPKNPFPIAILLPWRVAVIHNP
jgi:hypothetical protein